MIDDLKDATLDRRSLLRSAGGFALGAGALALLAGCGGDDDNGGSNPTPIPPTKIGDSDVLNFALNLEYLEAEYYLRAARGTTLETYHATGPAGSTPGAVTGGSKVTNFTTDYVQALAEELAEDELTHVLDLLGALGGNAVARPAIDFTGAFNAIGTKLGRTFDPFGNEKDFLLGSFIFEDVGVTAYLGGATLLKSKANLITAAKVLGVEAYHAGAIRTIIYRYTKDTSIVADAQGISDARDQAGGTDVDQGVAAGEGANIFPVDGNGLAFVRTTAQVIDVVTLGGTNNKGGFFPQGLNGKVK